MLFKPAALLGGQALMMAHLEAFYAETFRQKPLGQLHIAFHGNGMRAHALLGSSQCFGQLILV